MNKQFIITISAIFVLLSVVFFALRVKAPAFQFAALETGNAIMALLAFITYAMVRNKLDGSPGAFVRGVSGASFLKLMVCMVSILVYILLNRTTIHKPSVFVLFGIYAVYTIAETWLLSKLVRE
jgi:hypothetical protein